VLFRSPLLAVSPAAVLVTVLRPGAEPRSWIVALQNPDAEPRRVTLRWRRGGRVTWTSSDSAARPGAAITWPLALPPHGTAVVRVDEQ
jgi:hypothetical protein